VFTHITPGSYPALCSAEFGLSSTPKTILEAAIAQLAISIFLYLILIIIFFSSIVLNIQKIIIQWKIC